MPDISVRTTRLTDCPTDAHLSVAPSALFRLDEMFESIQDCVMEVGGYIVQSVNRGKHDGADAVLLTLADSMGTRSIGRMAIRLDATRDASLDVNGYFLSEEDRDDLLRMIEGLELVPARMLKAGDIVRVTVNDLDEESPWQDGDFKVLDVRLVASGTDVEVFYTVDEPGRFCTASPDELVEVVRSV